MPARKHRDGAELEEWLARKERFKFQNMVARETAKQLSGHTLLRLEEAAAMLGISKKTLRDLEGQGLSCWPRRVTLSTKVTGYRLKDVEALIDSGMAAREAEPVG
jgi:predicted DNA-binding transcriptional regulator AlpA